MISISLIASIALCTNTHSNNPTSPKNSSEFFQSFFSALNSTFPKLLIPGYARILYNAPEIVRGAYDSSRFFYRLDPFELDSLDDFSELALNFKGELISGGIFPPLKESLKIMNDFALLRSNFFFLNKRK